MSKTPQVREVTWPKFTHKRPELWQQPLTATLGHSLATLHPTATQKLTWGFAPTPCSKCVSLGAFCHSQIKYKINQAPSLKQGAEGTYLLAVQWPRSSLPRPGCLSCIFTTRTAAVTDVFESGRNDGALRPGRHVGFR